MEELISAALGRHAKITVSKRNFTTSFSSTSLAQTLKGKMRRNNSHYTRPTAGKKIFHAGHSLNDLVSLPRR